MGQSIKILSEQVINKIAAGEVVERPASVVKELIENSLDAGATEILIDVERAGSRLIRIADNGGGMSKDDARTAFERHATSKITNDTDLEAIRTLGFRGEALSSIAAVSHVKLSTAERNSPVGVTLEIEGGTVKKVSESSTPAGAVFEISHLFFNTPARLKFLKSPATEFSHMLGVVSRQALAYPAIRFKLTHNKKLVLDLPRASGIKERAFQLFGAEITNHLFECSGGREHIRCFGLIGTPAFTRAERTYQEFYVNQRAVKNASLTHALYSAYDDMLMRNRHPIGYVFIEIDPALVDVNVHPAKTEVRFRNQSQIHDLVKDVLREGLRAQGLPATSVSDATPSYGERIKESFADYLERHEGARQNSQQNSTHPFGRRKGDAWPLQPRHTTSESALREPGGDAYTQPSFLAEHDIVPLVQVHDSYIVAQSREGIMLIDQHAAHERVLYEKLQDQFTTGNTATQSLLIPESVELGPAQGTLLNEYLPELHRLGLVVEDFGNGVFMIKAVPFLLVGADYKKLLLDILDEITIHGKSRKFEELRREILSVMACHPAIKVHRRLDPKEMKALLDDLFHCAMPHTCPHGRPTIVTFSMNEIQKMFKRI